MSEAYSAFLVGGPYGIAGRITGSQPRKLTKRERIAFKRVLARGYTIEVRCASKDAWAQMAPDLYRQLGLAG